MKAIVGKQARDLAPGLLAFLSGTRPAEPSGEILRGAAGELCVLPDTPAGDAGSDLCPWTEIRLAGDLIEVEGGRGFRAVDRRQAHGALEFAVAVSFDGRARPHWRQRVLLALRDQAALGRSVRALLERGRDRLSFARVRPGSIHPQTEFLLLVRDAPLYVVLEILDEDLGHAFYEASHATEPDQRLGLFLPWGRDFPLVAALTARLDRACVCQVSGHLAALDVEAFAPVDSVLAPGLSAELLAVTPVPHGELRVPVPLRLAALDPAQPAPPTEIWRVSHERLDHLTAELGCAEDRLAGLLAQVVRLGADASPSVFIWAPAGADEDGEALALTELPGFARARARLGNLLLPARHGLLPTLGDDSLRSLFELRPDLLTVIDVGPNGSWVRYRLPVADFRPLRTSLVDYLLDVHEQDLLALCASARFDFDAPVLGPAEPESAPSSPSPEKPEETPQPTPTGGRASDREPATPLPTVTTASATASLPPAAPPREWPARLEASTHTLVAAPNDEGCWHDFFDASLAAGRHEDAGRALLRLLPGCDPGRGHRLLSALLGAGERATESVPANLAQSDDPLTSLAQGVEQVLGLALVALAPPVALPPEIRRGIGRLPARVRPLALPRLTWTAARLAFALTRDGHLLAEARLWVEPALLALGVREASPPLVAEALEARNGASNRAAVESFCAAAALGRGERSFLRLAYAWRRLGLGAGVDADLLAELAEEIKAARHELGPIAEQLESAWHALAHVRAHDRESLADCAVDPSLRAVLIAEGYLPPLHESAETQIERQARGLEAAPPADAALRAAALFEQVSNTAFAGLDAMFTVVDRLRRADQREALQALRARVSQAAARVDGSGRVAMLLAGLGTALAAALDPGREPVPGYGELAARAARLEVWDRAVGVRTVLSALAPLPVAARRLRAVSLYRMLREQGVVHGGSDPQPIRVDEQRALLRLVNLLVVPVDQTPDGERWVRSEWSSLRATLRQDLEQAGLESDSPRLRAAAP